jgi:hypothetical protein
LIIYVTDIERTERCRIEDRIFYRIERIQCCRIEGIICYSTKRILSAAGLKE